MRQECVRLCVCREEGSLKSWGGGYYIPERRQCVGGQQTMKWGDEGRSEAIAGYGWAHFEEGARLWRECERLLVTRGRGGVKTQEGSGLSERQDGKIREDVSKSVKSAKP